MKLAPLDTVRSAHDDSIWIAAWLPTVHDQSPPLILTGSLDKTVRLWIPAGPEKLSTNTCHCLGEVSVAAHLSGRISASASIDSFFRVFNVGTNELLLLSRLLRLKFNPQGTTLVAAGGGSASVKLWDTTHWQLITTLSIPCLEGVKPTEKAANKKFALFVAWIPDGRQIACGSMDDTISMFDVARVKITTSN